MQCPTHGLLDHAAVSGGSYEQRRVWCSGGRRSAHGREAIVGMSKLRLLCALCRDCSAAFHLAPYQGKYPAPHRAPDPLEMQKLLAGMADRGADVAVVECEADGLADGRCWLFSCLNTPAASSQRLPCCSLRVVSRSMNREGVSPQKVGSTAAGVLAKTNAGTMQRSVHHHWGISRGSGKLWEGC